MAAGELHGAELKAGLREGGGHIDEDDLAQAESGIADVAQSRLGPEVIDREQEHDVVGQSHGVPEKIPDLAPRRIGDDTVDRLRPRDEIAAAFELAPEDF